MHGVSGSSCGFGTFEGDEPESAGPPGVPLVDDLGAHHALLGGESCSELCRGHSPAKVPGVDLVGGVDVALVYVPHLRPHHVPLASSRNLWEVHLRRSSPEFLSVVVEAHETISVSNVWLSKDFK